VSCERRALFHLQIVLGSVTRWYVQYGYYIHAIHGTRKLNGKRRVRCASLILLHSATAARTVRQNLHSADCTKQKQHGTSYQKTSIDQHIIESSSMQTLTAERYPEGMIAPLLNKDWKTALTVVLHSPHWEKRVDPREGSPLIVAILGGAPVGVVTALLEACPDATTIGDRFNYVSCHFACTYGISSSSEGMKMLLRCNPDAAGLTNSAPMQFGHSLQMRKSK
jgi:hypothetical protein